MSFTHIFKSWTQTATRPLHASSWYNILEERPRGSARGGSS